ncbi:unnamed protein product, partial [Adineta steineri]
DEPRVTTFPIVWDEQQSTDQLVFAELTEDEKKIAELNEELEMCHSLENVNCTNETPTETNELAETDELITETNEIIPETNEIITETNESTEPKTTNEIITSSEQIITNEPIVATEPLNTMD